MPFLTKLEDTNGDVHLVLLQRKLKRGTRLDTDGLGPNYIVRATKYVATRGKDYSVDAR